MIKTFKTPLLAFFYFVMCVAIITSCKKNNDVNSGNVELLSFGPTGAQHGDTLRFIGNNLDKVTEIDLTGAIIPQASFLQQTAEQILIIVPQETEQGFITLKTPVGDIVSKTKLNLDVPVVITSIPAEARPGDNITISGNFLNWVTRITFGKDKVVESFVSKSLNQLVVTVPKDAQTGQLIVTTGGTEPVDIVTDSTLKVTLPAISALSPNPVEREGNLTITGTNLDLTKGVLFKGLTEPDTIFVSKSATQLVVKVPKDANKGAITLVAYSDVTVESAEPLKLVGDLPPLAPLAAAIFTDALQNGFSDWGYGGETDKNNTENVREGAVAVKKTFTGWDAVRFAGSSLPTAGRSEVVFSVFGGPGMDGKEASLIINDNWGIKKFIIKEGEWVEFKFTIADLGNPAEIKDWGIQCGTPGFIYVDQVGLR